MTSPVQFCATKEGSGSGSETTSQLSFRERCSRLIDLDKWAEKPFVLKL